MKNIENRYREKKDTIKASVKKYYIENKEATLEQKKKYYRLNKSTILQKHKIYYDENKSKLLAQKKDYKQHGKRTSVRIVKKRNRFCWEYNTGKLVHVAIAERVLGRRFLRGECCHHIDGNGLNNLHSNLLICTKSYHTWLHWQLGGMR